MKFTRSEQDRASQQEAEDFPSKVVASSFYSAHHTLGSQADQGLDCLVDSRTAAESLRLGGRGNQMSAAGILPDSDNDLEVDDLGTCAAVAFVAVVHLPVAPVTTPWVAGT